MYQNTPNEDIRRRIAAAGVTHWQLAARAGINPSTLSVWMRMPLEKMDPRRVQLMAALSMLEKERAKGAEHGKEQKG